eukprot:scaffold189719_cov24-Tisochrysis_lutea.AAC.4
MGRHIASLATWMKPSAASSIEAGAPAPPGVLKGGARARHVEGLVLVRPEDGGEELGAHAAEHDIGVGRREVAALPVADWAGVRTNLRRAAIGEGVASRAADDSTAARIRRAAHGECSAVRTDSGPTTKRPSRKKKREPPPAATVRMSSCGAWIVTPAMCASKTWAVGARVARSGVVRCGVVGPGGGGALGRWTHQHELDVAACWSPPRHCARHLLHFARVPRNVGRGATHVETNDRWPARGMSRARIANVAAGRAGEHRAEARERVGWRKATVRLHEGDVDLADAVVEAYSRGVPPGGA